MSEKWLNIVEFSTNNSKYIFDGVSSEIFPVEDSTIYIIKNYYKLKSSDMFKELQEKNNMTKEDFDAKYKYVEHLIDMKMLYDDENDLNNINVEDDIFESKSSQLSFVMTEECNMRCEYCIYSDKYPKEITYSKDELSFETAKKAFDIFYDIHKEKVKRGYKKPPMISFYGGEPLLKYNLMVQIVDYIKTVDNSTVYYITTNGTILNDEIINFLIEFNFIITFSLDGFKENHDRNRITVNGKPTFDIIVENIKKFQSIKKERNIKQLISFNYCYDNYTDLYKCARFFEDNYEIFYPFFILYNQINPFDNTYYSWVEKNKMNLEKNILKNSYSMIKSIFINKINESDKFKEIVINLFIGEFSLMIRSKWANMEYFNACIPLSKMAVYADGTFSLCEKMNKKHPIGNVRDGINIFEIKKVVSLFKENYISKKCKYCEIKRICPTCYMYMNDKGDINKEFCDMQKSQLVKRLIGLYDILEEIPDFLHKLQVNNKTLDVGEIK